MDRVLRALPLLGGRYAQAVQREFLKPVSHRPDRHAEHFGGPCPVAETKPQSVQDQVAFDVREAAPDQRTRGLVLREQWMKVVEGVRVRF